MLPILLTRAKTKANKGTEGMDTVHQGNYEFNSICPENHRKTRFCPAASVCLVH